MWLPSSLFEFLLESRSFVDVAKSMMMAFDCDVIYIMITWTCGGVGVAAENDHHGNSDSKEDIVIYLC